MMDRRTPPPTNMPPFDEENIVTDTQRIDSSFPKAGRSQKPRKNGENLRGPGYASTTMYQNQEMFGDPCKWPNNPNVVILPLIWTYIHKITPITTNKIVEKACTSYIQEMTARQKADDLWQHWHCCPQRIRFGNQVHRLHSIFYQHHAIVFSWDTTDRPTPDTSD
jgi:hypothetical protein